MGISASDLSAMRTTVNGFLPSACLIERTAEATICRVDADARQLHIEGMPSYVRAQRWCLSLPDRRDVLIGDRLIVTGLGTYDVVDVANPTSYSAVTTVYCVKTDRGGGLTLPMAPNQIVDFENLRTNQTLTDVPVFIEQLAGDGIVAPASVKYPYIIHYSPELRFADTSQISAGNRLAWDDLPGGGAILHKPQRILGPLTWMAVHLEEAS